MNTWSWTALLVLAGSVGAAAGDGVPPVTSAAQQGGSPGVPLPLFPADNWWNVDVSSAPVDPNSANYLGFIGLTRGLHPDFGGINPDETDGVYGMPFIVVEGDQPKKAVQFLYQDESDGVDHDNGEVSFPFYPIPVEAQSQPHWIECGPAGSVDLRDSCDRHILIVDRTNNDLYEIWNAWYDAPNSQWRAGSGAFFDMDTNDRRPEGWTSADAAGLAILPGLVRYDEVHESVTPIGHAFRVTLDATRGHVFPASHTASTSSHPNALPLGARLRLKASKDISGFPAPVQRIFQAMKTHGLIVADNGSDMYVSGTFDTRWNNDVLNPAFRALKVSDFEVVQLGWQPPAPSATVSFAAGGTSFPEAGGSVTAVVTLTTTDGQPSTGTVTAGYATTGGTATSGTDFTAATGTLVFPAGTASGATQSIPVAVVNDALDEDDETFTIGFTTVTGAATGIGSRVVTILDDDPVPSVSIADASAAEGAGTLGFAVTLSAPSGRTVAVQVQTANGTAVAPSDYGAVSAPLSFAAGQTMRTLSIAVVPDVMYEHDETFQVTLSSPSNAALGDAVGVGTILNDDAAPSLRVSDPRVLEPTTGERWAVFRVSLSAVSGVTATVSAATADGTAAAGSDYTAKSDTVTFPPGTTIVPFRVAVLSDGSGEPDETFGLDLSSPSHATIADGTGTATITETAPAPHDWNGDGHADLLFRNQSTGANAAWFMDGASRLGTGALASAPNVGYRIVGVGDFNDDLRPDLVWRNATNGANSLWLMNGTTKLDGAPSLPPTTDPNWRIVGTGDFNGDEQVDLVWRNYATGANAVWYLDGTVHVGSALLGSAPDVSWSIAGVADFNGDGKPDLLWRNYATGANAVWTMDGVTRIGSALIDAAPDTRWRVVGTVDLDGDGDPDIVWRNQTSGSNAVWFMDGLVRAGSAALPSATNLDWRVVPSDF